MSQLKNNTVTMSFRADERLAERIDAYCEKLALDKTSLIKMCVKVMLDRLDKQRGEILFDEVPPLKSYLKSAESPEEYTSTQSSNAQKNTPGGESVRTGCA